jgi:hypothetical protein
MKAEIRFAETRLASIGLAQNDILDDAEDATESNKEDVVRQDFALISSSTQRLRTRSWIDGQYNDAEEEAEDGKMKAEIHFV